MTAFILPIVQAAEVFEHPAQWLSNVRTTTLSLTTWPHTGGSECSCKVPYRDARWQPLRTSEACIGPVIHTFVSVPFCRDEREVCLRSIVASFLLEVLPPRRPTDEKILTAGLKQYDSTTSAIDRGLGCLRKISRRARLTERGA